MAKRSQLRVSGGQDARSERPATRYGQPEAGLGVSIPRARSRRRGYFSTVPEASARLAISA
jgi:hypothetical protein